MVSPLAEKYKFKYSTGEDYIDIETLLQSQLQFKKSFEIIQKEIFPDYGLRIRASSITNGSFELNLLFDLIEKVLPLAPPTIAQIDINSLRSIFDFFQSYLDIRIFLKGKKPKDTIKMGDNIKIVGDNNQFIKANTIVYNMYSSSLELDSSVRKNFKSLNNDPMLKAIDIIKDEEDIIKIKRNNFEAIAAVNENLAQSIIEEVKEVVLTITRPILYWERKSKWGFIFQGHKIEAYLGDVEFLNSVKKGKISFARGDALKVELKFLKEFDEELKTYVIKKMEVIKVFEKFHGSSQISIDVD